MYKSVPILANKHLNNIKPKARKYNFWMWCFFIFHPAFISTTIQAKIHPVTGKL